MVTVVAVNSNSRDRLLRLLWILMAETSEIAPKEYYAISNRLKKSGIICERKSFYRDIQALNRNGFSVKYKRGIGGGWYLERAPYQIRELLNAGSGVNHGRQ